MTALFALTRAERRVLAPPSSLTVSQWADANRVVDSTTSSLDGPFRTDLNPPFREIQDAAGDPSVRSIALMTCSQAGKTTATQNILLHAVVERPRPAMLVMPTEVECGAYVKQRMIPAVDHCRPASKMLQQVKDARSKHLLTFDSMTLTMAWSNSPNRLASRSIGLLIIDEADKFPLYSGKEANPIKLAQERLKWFPDSLEVIASTPTLTTGPIFRRYQAGDRRQYHVPCAKCAAFQVLTFDQVKWPDEIRNADELEERRAAVYRCLHCGHEHPDDSDQRHQMMLRGVWVPEDARIDGDGRVELKGRPAAHRSYHLSSLYSPVTTWSQMAAEFLRSKDDPGDLMNWVNSWCGQPWVEQTADMKPQELRVRETPLVRGLVPKGAKVLVAGVDVQKDRIYYVIRAYGNNERSWTIDTGQVPGLEELESVLFGQFFPYEDAASEAHGLGLRLACIDSQYRTDEVYRFCANHPHHARPIKAAMRARAPFAASRIQRDYIGRAIGLKLWLLDSTYYKTKFVRMATAELDTGGSWRPFRDAPELYFDSLCSEHLVPVRNRRTGRTIDQWRVKPGKTHNHEFDCEVYATAAADMLALYATLRDDQRARTPSARTKVAGDRHDTDPDPGAPRRGDRRRSRGGWIRR